MITDLADHSLKDLLKQKKESGEMLEESEVQSVTRAPSDGALARVWRALPEAESPLGDSLRFEGVERAGPVLGVWNGRPGPLSAGIIIRYTVHLGVP